MGRFTTRKCLAYAGAFAFALGLAHSAGAKAPDHAPAAQTHRAGTADSPHPALFRIAQEALATIARHSGATTVDVRLAWVPDGLTLAVEDDGRGFDVTRLDGKGLGLSSMRERIEAIGGTLTLGSTSRGTCLQARVTLPHHSLVAAGKRGEIHK